MSLINDALRKARREAAARGERQEGPEVVVILPPRRSLVERPGVLVLLGAALVAAILLGALVAWWALRRPAQPVSVQGAPPQAAAAGPGRRIPAGEAPRIRRDGGRGDGMGSPPRRGSEVPPEAPRPAAARRAPARAPARPRNARPGARAEEDRPAAAPTPRPTPPSAPPPGPGSSAAAARREFVGEAALGGLTLRLDYLVYRPSDPFVQINGVELHQGWEISGYTVERIQTDRVILRGPGGTIVIRSH